MPQLIIRHARWEESAQALPRTPPRSPVQADWRVQSRADNQPQLAPVLLAAQGRQNPRLCNGADRDSPPAELLFVQLVLEKLGCDADELPQASKSPSRLSLRKLFLWQLHRPLQAATSVELVLSFRLRFLLPFASGLDKSGSPNILHTASLELALRVLPLTPTGSKLAWSHLPEPG